MLDSIPVWMQGRMMELRREREERKRVDVTSSTSILLWWKSHLFSHFFLSFFFFSLPSSVLPLFFAWNWNPDRSVTLKLILASLEREEREMREWEESEREEGEKRERWDDFLTFFTHKNGETREKFSPFFLTVKRENCLQECDAHVHSLSLAAILLLLSFSLLLFPSFFLTLTFFLPLFPYFIFLFPSFGFTTNNFSLSVSLSQDCQSSGRRRGFLCGFFLLFFVSSFFFSPLFLSYFNRISMHEWMCDDETLEAANGPLAQTIQSHLFVLLPSLDGIFHTQRTNGVCNWEKRKITRWEQNGGKIEEKKKGRRKKNIEGGETEDGEGEKLKMEREKLKRERERLGEKSDSKHQF